MQYDNFVWRLRCDNLAIDIQLPQDLEWVDEFSWSPIQQSVETTITGALAIQESKQLRGRPITLQGKDDMGWIQRTTGELLMQLKDTLACVMNLEYIEYSEAGQSYIGQPAYQYDVMFRHYEPPPLELENVLRFDNFESEAWYKVRNIKFMEATSTAADLCTANVTITVNVIAGSFNIGDPVTEHTSGTDCTEPNETGVSGAILGVSGDTLNLHIATGTLTIDNLLCVDGSNYGTILSIS